MPKSAVNLTPAPASASGRCGGGGCCSSSAASLLFGSKWTRTSAKNAPRRTHLICSSTTIRASKSKEEGNSKVLKELGLFALRKKIEGAVLRAEALAPPALEHEEARRIRREELMRQFNLWDDPAKSSEILEKLAHSTQVVDALKDLQYKAEEAKLIAELIETDVVNHRLFKQAYNDSEDVSKFLDLYEMSKLLNGPFDKHGASLVIKAHDKDPSSKMWAEQLVSMYLKWAERLGQKGRIAEKRKSKNGGINSATVEFEFKYAYGSLLGERGVHRMISAYGQPSIAALDITPLFLEPEFDLPIDEEELTVSFGSPEQKKHGRVESVVSIQHLPTGIIVQSSGERSRFANKMKALNRLKAKLLVILSEQGISEVSSIREEGIVDPWEHDVRRYMVRPFKLVNDLQTGIQIRDINAVLDGGIELLVAAHVNMRQSS